MHNTGNSRLNEFLHIFLASRLLLEEMNITKKVPQTINFQNVIYMCWYAGGVHQYSMLYYESLGVHFFQRLQHTGNHTIYIEFLKISYFTIWDRLQPHSLLVLKRPGINIAYQESRIRGTLPLPVFKILCQSNLDQLPPKCDRECRR